MSKFILFCYGFLEIFSFKILNFSLHFLPEHFALLSRSTIELQKCTPTLLKTTNLFLAISDTSLKGIVSRDFGGLQMILMDRIVVPYFRFHIVFKVQSFERVKLLLMHFSKSLVAGRGPFSLCSK